MTVLNRHFVTIALVLVAVLASVPPALTQSSRPGRDSAAIQRKVQRSASLQRQALEAMSEPAQAVKLVKSAWVQLKSAHDDLVVNSTIAKPPDPIIDLSMRKAYDALMLVQAAEDALNAGDRSGPDSAVALARDRLQQALKITNTLLATGF
jgi:hypothetical protein